MAKPIQTSFWNPHKAPFTLVFSLDDPVWQDGITDVHRWVRSSFAWHEPVLTMNVHLEAQWPVYRKAHAVLHVAWANPLLHPFIAQIGECQGCLAGHGQAAPVVASQVSTSKHLVGDVAFCGSSWRDGRGNSIRAQK